MALIAKDDEVIKQPASVVAAFSKAMAESKDKLGSDATLTLYGSDVAPDKAYNELRILSSRYYNGLINLHPLPYETDREQLLAALIRSSVCIMPSLHEGFGLAAWEAIAAGVPIVISKNSGVYDFIEQEYSASGVACIQSVALGGSMTVEDPNQNDVEVIKSAIIRVATDAKREKRLALDLRSRILAGGYTWANCAEQISKALGITHPTQPKEEEYNTHARSGKPVNPRARKTTSGLTLVSINPFFIGESPNPGGELLSPLSCKASKPLITSIVRGQFPQGDRFYPDGSYHEPNNGKLCLLLDRPTVAVRSAIEFMRVWASERPRGIECSATVDVGDIMERAIGERTYIESAMLNRAQLMHNER